VLTGGPGESQALATAVRAQQWNDIVDVVPAAGSLGIIADADAGADSVADLLHLAASLAVAHTERAERRFEVEVCFDGADLDGVAAAAGVSRPALIALLETTPLTVGWIGFMPGFPYLLGLPASLEDLPRLHRPRAMVPPGAFALAGGYAGIYPTATPGGWNVLGRTSFVLFDPEVPPYATLSPGDSIFVRGVPSLAPGTAPGTGAGSRAPLTAAGQSRRLVVTEPGVLTTVQDRGRLGVAHVGVPPAGPADPQSHAVANAAVGNLPGAATLEITMSGPTLRFDSASFVAVVGDCPTWIDGREMPPAAVQLVCAGQSLRVGPMRSGVHAYVGIAGGVEVPRRLGSRSSDIVTGIPPGPLRAGDELAVGEPGRARGRWALPTGGDPGVLRLELGPDGLDDGALGRLLGSEWTVHPESNRVGTRLSPAGSDTAGSDTVASADLESADLESEGAARVRGGSGPSRPTVTGAVQLPPDGSPVLLGPDHGTVGGYPVVGVLTPASLSRAGQLRPGDRVRFEEWHTGDPGDDLVSADRLVGGWMAPDAGVLG